MDTATRNQVANEKIDRATAKANDRKSHCHWYALGRLDQVAAPSRLGSSEVARAFADGQYAAAFAFELGATTALGSIQDEWEAFIATWRG